jgi:hypothetical protein
MWVIVTGSVEPARILGALKSTEEKLRNRVSRLLTFYFLFCWRSLEISSFSPNLFFSFKLAVMYAHWSFCFIVSRFQEFHDPSDYHDDSGVGQRRYRICPTLDAKT